MTNVKLSVITINYNNYEGLKKTIKSVRNQTNQNFEYIIIDGNSDDNSLQIINENIDIITTWVSELDEGIYNAMNKGIKKSNGDYIIFINSGDYFYSNHIIENILSHLHNEDLIYGNLCHINNSKQEIFHYPEFLSIQYIWKYSLPHPSTFIKKSLLFDIGLFNEKDKITSDWQFFMSALFLKNCSYKKLNFTISTFIGNGISNKFESLNRIENEKYSFMRKNFPKINLIQLNTIIKHEDILRDFKYKHLTKLLFNLGFYKNIEKYLKNISS